MTRKRKIICKKTPTKLLFKNSQNSVNTFSKTYSDASRFCTKSLVMQLKQKLPKARYYENQGTLKRDLSIETDICILRRYYKKNRKRLLNRGVASAKSKYSDNLAEKDTINEFTRDSSACGDSELTNNQENRGYNINLTSFVVNNLKKLLNDWIKKYLLENNETKEKIDSVLDSILHKLDFHKNDTSSCTYTVDVELGDQSSKPDSLSTISRNLKLKAKKRIEDLNRQKSSNLTTPLNNKYLQVISTLSIPRKQMKLNKSKSVQKVKKFRHKKLLLSISKSSKYLLRSSSLDFLAVRTKSLTKRCATYQRNDKEILDRPRNMFIQKSYCNNNSLNNYSISDKTISPKDIHDVNVPKVNSKKIPSIYKNMYAISPSHIISYESTNTGSQTCFRNITEHQVINIIPSLNSTVPQNQKIIDEHEQSDQLVTIDFESSKEISQLDLKLPDKLDAKLKTSKMRKNKTGYRKINLFNKKICRFHSYKTMKSKQFTICKLFKKSNNKNEKEKLLNHFQSVLKYLSNYEREKVIQLHIQINVCPINGNEENVITKSDTNLKDSNIDVRNVNIKEKDMNNIPALNSQNIISLLDGATSQSKYIVSRETSTDSLKETSEKYIKLSENQIYNSKMAQEIDELRVIIKSLAMTAENLISEHIYNSNYVRNESNVCKNDLPVNINLQHAIEKSLIDSAVEKQSKGNQIANNVPKRQIVSGLKLRKEPKNKQFSPYLTKKSNSYNFISSESIMKITDMTSAAENITCEKMIDKALTCSLPKSKSLFEMAVGPHKRKLLAFYCDDFVRPDEYIINVCERSTPTSSNQQGYPYPYKHAYSKCHMHQSCNDNTCTGRPQFTCEEFVPKNDDRKLIDNSSSSVCIKINPKARTKKFTIRNHDGVGFKEGCFYCVLMWIPLMVIVWLFYIFVLKDLIVSRGDSKYNETHFKKDQLKTDPSPPPTLPSLSLSDLGF